MLEKDLTAGRQKEVKKKKGQWMHAQVVGPNHCRQMRAIGDARLQESLELVRLALVDQLLDEQIVHARRVVLHLLRSRGNLIGAAEELGGPGFAG